MRPRSRARDLLLLCALLAAAIAAARCGGSITPTPLQPTVATITTLPSIDEMLADRTLGPASSGNTIVEYLSFWCTACADFYATVSPQLKTRYADAGKARVIFRNLFLSGETITAAALSRCVGASRFWDAADRLFRSQSTWMLASDPDASIRTQMMGFGMSSQIIEQCVGNTALRDGLVAVHQQDAINASYQLPGGGTAIGISRVPAVVVNGVKLDSSAADNAPTIENIDKFLK